VVDPKISHPPGTVLSENTWANFTLEDAKKGARTAYRVSKVFAEKELWKFVEEENPSFGVTATAPGTPLP
jgi:NADPH-dependent methylglyoxal reductase